MIVFKCDVCKRNQPNADSLKTGNVRISLGTVLLVNLPSVDRCESCYSNMSESLKTVVQSLDDTQHRMDSDPDILIPEEIDIDTVLGGPDAPWSNEGSK